jgi:hypothetical protein
MFLMDDDRVAGLIRNPYRASGHENLEKRVIFTNSILGEPDVAFLGCNDPRGDNLEQIQELVKKGHFIRTESDEPIQTMLQSSFVMRDAAFANAAQLISVEFPSVGMAARYNSYFVTSFDGAVTVRCDTMPWVRDVRG